MQTTLGEEPTWGDNYKFKMNLPILLLFCGSDGSVTVGVCVYVHEFEN